VLFRSRSGRPSSMQQESQMARSRFHVIPQNGRWRIAQVGDVVRGAYPTQDEAVQAARLLALITEPAQVVVHDETGTVRAEHYYGHDPERT